MLKTTVTLKGFVTDVACPTCPAQKYVPCTDFDFKPAVHRARMERALRAEKYGRKRV